MPPARTIHTCQERTSSYIIGAGKQAAPGSFPAKLLRRAPARHQNDRKDRRSKIIGGNMGFLTPDKDRLQHRAALVSFVGSMLEYYDFFIYGTAAALIFPRVFFVNVDPATGTLLALLSFGIGYIARPVGAVILGHFGDRIGRKTVLVFTLVVMAVSTLAIGLFPVPKTLGTPPPIPLTLFPPFTGPHTA